MFAEASCAAGDQQRFFVEIHPRAGEITDRHMQSGRSAFGCDRNSGGWTHDLLILFYRRTVKRTWLRKYAGRQLELEGSSACVYLLLTGLRGLDALAMRALGQ